MRALILAALLALGCADATAYRGAFALEPFLDVVDRLEFDPMELQHPRMIHVRRGEVINPTNGPLRVFVSCGVTMFDVLLTPRTLQEFTIARGDGVCTLSYGVHLERMIIF